MTHLETSSTSNGYEIKHPVEKIDANGLRTITENYGIQGENSQERLKSLKKLDANTFAYMLTDINKGLQGSDESLIDTNVVTIAGKNTIAPENRYDLFNNMFDKIIQTPDNINPARIGDALGIALVMLHPFADGNGRTSRMLGMIFRDDFDTKEDTEYAFGVLSASRDELRKNNQFTVNGYVPLVHESFDQSDPVQVQQYFETLLTNDQPNQYMGPFGQAPLIQEADYQKA